MSSIILSPNMNLPVPVVGQEAGPDYATDINNCMLILDNHNHTSGSGVLITPAALDINTDLSFADNRAVSLKSVTFQSQSVPLPASSPDTQAIYVSGVDLYYNDGDGNQVRMTQSGGVAGTPGSISGLVSPASATYVSADSTFVWQSAANTPAHMDGGSVILRNLSINSKGLTLNPPLAMSVDYSLVLPALPVANSFMQLDTAGNMSAVIPLSKGITASNIADLTITGGQIANATIGSEKLTNPLIGTLGYSQEFTSSGTFNVPTGATLVAILGCGGGGGGGGGSINGPSAGGGGGGGAPIISTIVPVTSGAAITVTIGAGGSGGAAGAVSPGNPGSAGSTTSFGSIISFRGGSAGAGNTTGGGSGGAGGTTRVGGFCGAIGTAGSAGPTGGAGGAGYTSGVDSGAGGAGGYGNGGGGGGGGSIGVGGAGGGPGAAGTVGGIGAGGGGGAGGSGGGVDGAAGGNGGPGYIKVVVVG